ncbi:hypothetical protein DL770_010381 [Monosporascus sp. CRB-9-2]|nr:hypothetical protein DL770_010381 [Monosporascus sp. CRB-9-2]
MVFEENETLLLVRGEEAEPAKFRREGPTSPGAAEQLTVAVKTTVRDDNSILARRDNTTATATATASATASTIISIIT